MKDGPSIAALVAAPSRAEMLTALLADRALTATELAAIASVTKQTASTHLTKLVEAGLVRVEPQGRHRYFRLAGRDVAQLLESLMGVAFRAGAVRPRSSPRQPALRKARVCYDHLAGELAVAVFERLQERQWLVPRDGLLELTDTGHRQLRALGIATAGLTGGRRPLCKPCLDWSERREHLAGALGAALLARIFALGWAGREAGSRVVRFSPEGEYALGEFFGLPPAIG